MPAPRGPGAAPAPAPGPAPAAASPAPPASPALLAAAAISIIIPDLDSPLVDRALAALRDQGAPGDGIEVLVVGSDAQRLVPRDGTLRFLETAERLNPAAARNRGVAAAHGARLLFTDADCRPAAGWVRQLAAALDATPVAGGAVTFPRPGRGAAPPAPAPAPAPKPVSGRWPTTSPRSTRCSPTARPRPTRGGRWAA